MGRRLIKENNTKKHARMKKINIHLHSIINIVLNIFLISIISVLPFYSTNGYAQIGTDKNLFLFHCSKYIFGILLPLQIIYIIIYNVIYKPNIKMLIKNIHITDIFVICYGIAILLSYLSTDFRNEATRGTEGWYMGILTQLIFLLTYFFTSKVWNRKNWVLALFIPVSTIVYIIAILNRFGIYPIEMQSARPQFISTIGNINWYCGYMVTLLFAIMYMYWFKDDYKFWQKILLLMYIAIGLGSLVTQGSSSGIFALFGVLLFMFIISINDSIRIQKYFNMLFALSSVCLLIYAIRQLFPESFTYKETATELLTNSFVPIVMFLVSAFVLAGVRICSVKFALPMKFFRFLRNIVLGMSIIFIIIFTGLIIFNTSNPGAISIFENSSIFTFSPEWGSKRGATWMASLMVFSEQNLWKKIVGIGPDCMSVYMYQSGSAELITFLNEQFPTQRLTNAHNEWISILVNLGVLGLVCFVGIVSSSIYRFLKKSLNNKSLLTGIVGACGISVLAYTINNLFSFQQTLNGINLFIILGVGENIIRELKTEDI